MDEDTGIAAVMGVLNHHVVELAEGARSPVHSRFAQGGEEQTTDRQTDDSQLIRATRPESKITCFHTLKDDVSASP